MRKFSSSLLARYLTLRSSWRTRRKVKKVPPFCPFTLLASSPLTDRQTLEEEKEKDLVRRGKKGGSQELAYQPCLKPRVRLPSSPPSSAVTAPTISCFRSSFSPPPLFFSWSVDFPCEKSLPLKAFSIVMRRRARSNPRLLRPPLLLLLLRGLHSSQLLGQASDIHKAPSCGCVGEKDRALEKRSGSHVLT